MGNKRSPEMTEGTRDRVLTDYQENGKPVVTGFVRERNGQSEPLTNPERVFNTAQEWVNRPGEIFPLHLDRLGDVKTGLGWSEDALSLLQSLPEALAEAQDFAEGNISARLAADAANFDIETKRRKFTRYVAKLTQQLDRLRTPSDTTSPTKETKEKVQTVSPLQRFMRSGVGRVLTGTAFASLFAVVSGEVVKGQAQSEATQPPPSPEATVSVETKKLIQERSQELFASINTVLNSIETALKEAGIDIDSPVKVSARSDETPEATATPSATPTQTEATPTPTPDSTKEAQQAKPYMVLNKATLEPPSAATVTPSPTTRPSATPTEAPKEVALAQEKPQLQPFEKLNLPDAQAQQLSTIFGDKFIEDNRFNGFQKDFPTLRLVNGRLEGFPFKYDQSSSFGAEVHEVELIAQALKLDKITVRIMVKKEFGAWVYRLALLDDKGGNSIVFDNGEKETTQKGSLFWVEGNRDLRYLIRTPRRGGENDVVDIRQVDENMVKSITALKKVENTRFKNLPPEVTPKLGDWVAGQFDKDGNPVLLVVRQNGVDLAYPFFDPETGEMLVPPAPTPAFKMAGEASNPDVAPTGPEVKLTQRGGAGKDILVINGKEVQTTKLVVEGEREVSLGITKDKVYKSIDASTLSGYVTEKGKEKIKFVTNNGQTIEKEVSFIRLSVPKKDGSFYKVKAISFSDSFDVQTTGKVKNVLMFSSEPVLNALSEGQQTRLTIIGSNTTEAAIRELYKNYPEKAEEIITFFNSNVLEAKRLQDLNSGADKSINNEATVFFIMIQANLPQ